MVMDDPELPLAIGLKGGKLRISPSSALPPHRAPRCEQVFQRASCPASATGKAEKVLLQANHTWRIRLACFCVVFLHLVDVVRRRKTGKLFNLFMLAALEIIPLAWIALHERDV
jgi:hypothetical protein